MARMRIVAIVSTLVLVLGFSLVSAPSTLAASEGSSNCYSSPGMSHCDGYDVNLSTNCWSGSYNISTSLQGTNFPDGVWWSPNCQSNFFNGSVPANNTLCAGTTCNKISQVWLIRFSHPYSYCVANAANCSWSLTDKCGYPGAGSPGTCSLQTFLWYCGTQQSGCGTTSFNGEYIGYSSWWSSFRSDMLWAYSNAVKVCVQYINTNNGYRTGTLCGGYH